MAKKSIENRIRIKLKAYDFRLLDKSVAEIIKNTRNTGAKIVGPVPLPTERTFYTVLKSPHVNKKHKSNLKCWFTKDWLILLIPLLKQPEH